MEFLTQVYRRSDPGVMTPVKVSFYRLLHQEGDNPRAELQVKIYVDRNEDGIIDASEQVHDVQRTFVATPSQFGVVFNRIRGSGNTMALIRQFCKNQIDAHNTAVNPGGTPATHTDLDNDQPNT